MSFFTKLFNEQLYVAEQGTGFLCVLLPVAPSSSVDGIELADALLSTSLNATFVFSAGDPGLTADNAAAFVSSVLTVVTTAGAARGMVWLSDASNITTQTAHLIGLQSDGQQVSVVTGMVAPLVLGLNLNVPAGLTLSLSGTTGTLNGSPPINFTGQSQPDGALIIMPGTLEFAGAQRGVIQFGTYLTRLSLYSSLSWGFQFLMPSSNGQNAITEWLPLADGSAPLPSDQIGFRVDVDPSDPLNTLLPSHRTAFVFSGKTIAGQGGGTVETVLVSNYRTSQGSKVYLWPVLPAEGASAGRLVFNEGVRVSDQSQQFQLAPEGDFVLGIDNAAEQMTYKLMCGLHGTEYVKFQARAGSYAGDRLRFSSQQPAYAPRYPFPPVSPVGPPQDPLAKLLDTTYTTSWATVVRAPSALGVEQPAAVSYVAQPKGASLYGRDDLINSSDQTLFGARGPDSAALDPAGAFPLAPYAGVAAGDGKAFFLPAQIEDFERQVIGPTRRAAIGANLPPAADSAADAPYNVTTPAGLIATVGADGRWSKLLLGQNLRPSPHQFYFCNPDPNLQATFQNGQLFLVVANAQNLGALAGAGAGACDAAAAFYNWMNIEDWQLQADVGQYNNYGDYANVLIVKGRKGAIYDPTNDQTKQTSLVSNPDMWTQGNTFAAPADLVNNPAQPPVPPRIPGTPDPTEQVILSQWLRDYFQKASDATGTERDYFQYFNQIAKLQNWTGILVLRMRIADIPKDLAGITAGVPDPQLFNAHHFGIEIGQVENDPQKEIQLASSSSMFGLIDYVDPAFTPPDAGKQPQPVAPPAGAIYDFRLLMLKVLFRNTAVQRFQSYAQITLNQFFGMPVTRMGEGGNVYNSVILGGTYQNNNGQPVYSLSSVGDNTFYFDSNVVNKIEITTATMSTRDAGSAEDGKPTVSWFGLDGFIDFKIVQARVDPATGAGTPFDLFSFGNDDGQDLTRRGLSFSNLGLLMSFQQYDPPPILTFTTDEIRFDVSTSTPRAKSLFTNFALGLQGLVGGGRDSTPGQAGYLPVVTDARLTGVDGGAWQGLRYRLNMGSPGALDSNVGLTSYLVTAWSPDSAGVGSYKALLGIELPGTGGGAKLISLQNVLKLSIGQLRLTYDQDKSSFLLMLTEIALKFLGLLKIPPGGSTLFYLFGNPQSGGKPSGLGWYAMYNQDQPKPSQASPSSAMSRR